LSGTSALAREEKFDKELASFQTEARFGLAKESQRNYVF
jgi:hypothetical protein